MSHRKHEHQLPRGYTNWFIRKVDDLSLSGVLWGGLLLYVAVAVGFSVLLQVCAWAGWTMIYDGGEPVTGFGGILYFNFVTILTVGYGDLHPAGLGRMLATIEALIGVGLFGGIIGVVVLKLTQPAKNSIVFSHRAYYAIDEERFFIMFLNTSHSPLVNAEISYVLKLGHRNEVKPSKTTPYIADSVWILNLSQASYNDLRTIELYDDDGIKFAISGSYGFTNFATSVRYDLCDILAVPSRAPLERESLLIHPRLGDPEFENIFHYEPEGARPFADYAHSIGASAKKEQTNKAIELTRIGLKIPGPGDSPLKDNQTVIFKSESTDQNEMNSIFNQRKK
ncbi:two pore domain potassium channel family protein [Candidatus Sumerlaeota bacterium]|nr:two pore domain potassium channel family protein [Candidatus Sumerlaeota bacterium]